MNTWILVGLMVIGSTQADAIDKKFAKDGGDPEHLWLEEVESQEALKWVGERNSETVSEFTSDPEFAKLENRLLEILDSKARIPMISKAGPHYYNFWRDGDNPRGIWRRTTLEEYRKEEPAWETVLDLDELARNEKENWVFKGVTFLEPDHDRCLVQISRGGADASVYREFDVTTKSFVKEGFYLPEAKSRVSWRDRDSLFVGTNFGEGSLTDSGYPRIIKVWSRGTPLASAKTVFEGVQADVSVSAGRETAPGFERDYFERTITFWTSVFFLEDSGKQVRIDKPIDANAFIHRDRLFLELRSEWKVDGMHYPAGALLSSTIGDALKGKKKYDVLFQPTPEKSLAGVTLTKNYVVLNELENVRNRLYLMKPEQGGWVREPLPEAAPFSTISISAVDSLESDDYFMTLANYLTPTVLLHGSIGEKTTEPLKQSPNFFDASGLEISQHFAKSEDGTRVPYFQVSRKGTEGETPTLLYGYGGFEISMLPGYQATTGAAWLEKGGTYVVANIRGGGEYGPRWHQAALKENRARAYEDFAAVAEDLIRRKITSPQRLGIMGGSNGGLLMGNMLTRRPDLFGAIVCQVPLLDMRRYNKLLAGASWMAEYGNPDLPEEWEFIQTFSPYHNLQMDQKYPPILITTSTRDDRVHPGHARRMVAKMRTQGHNVRYYENIEGGHGGAANNKQSAFMGTLAYQFLWKELSK